MSLEAEFKSGALQRGRIRYFPVVPGRVEFTIEPRRRLLAEKPAIVAVELPGFLEATYRRALSRLPEMSVILYHRDGKRASSNESSRESEEEDQAIFIP